MIYTPLGDMPRPVGMAANILGAVAKILLYDVGFVPLVIVDGIVFHVDTPSELRLLVVVGEEVVAEAVFDVVIDDEVEFFIRESIMLC